MSKTTIRYLSLFICYFGIHYIEGLPPIGGLSIAQIWKIPLLLFLLFYNMFSLWKRTSFEKVGYWLSLEYVFSPEILLKPLGAFVRVSKQLPFILFFGFWKQYYYNRKTILEHMLYGLAQFVCMASLPTLLGIIQPLKGNLSAESFGIKGLTYFSGVFGAPHAAASYFCASILVIVNGFMLNKFKSKRSKIFNGLLFFVGLISLFKAYVRTGWLMLIVGLVCLTDIRRLTKKRLFIILCSTVIAISGILTLYSYNEAFHARLTGRNIYTHSGGNGIETDGSGRLDFWNNAVTGLWNADNVYYSLFGRGFTEVTADNLKTTGMEVFSHNQFLDALAQNGVIGISLLVAFNVFLFLYIKRMNGEHKCLCYALFGANFIFSFFQNEMYFDYAVIFSLAVAILDMEEEHKVESVEV